MFLKINTDNLYSFKYFKNAKKPQKKDNKKNTIDKFVKTIVF